MLRALLSVLLLSCGLFAMSESARGKIDMTGAGWLLGPVIDIGGNWYYRNPNGLSACYESLHIDTSKWRLAFEDYPVPADWPDFPHHAQLFQYFKDYVDHFGLRPTITFNTAVEKARRTADGLWEVKL